MLIIDSDLALRRALDSPIDPAVRRVLALRLSQQLGDARFIVVEPFDTMDAIETAAGLPIATSIVDGSRHPHPDFTPSWEWALAHQGCWEVLYLLADDDPGTVLLVPRRDDLNPTLLAVLRAFADDAPTTGLGDRAL